MSLADLPPLRDVVAAYDLGAKKSLGQHFLFDLNLTAKIARLAGPLDDCAVIEVGPGPGGLTRALLAAGAPHVIAIEKDQRFLGALRDIAEAAPGRLEIVEADALKADEPALIDEFGHGRPGVIVSNLPYNVGTPLLIKWLTAARWWRSMTLMFQKEVAERIVAQPATSAYGRLSVIAQLQAAPHLALEAPARAFTPPPKVDSAVVRFDPHPAGGCADIGEVERVTAAAFGQRRKMLRASLKAVAPARGVEAWLAEAGVDAQARPETLPPEAFAKLAALRAETTRSS